MRMSKLMDAHPVEEFRDPTSAAHQELVEIVEALARGSPPADE